MINLETILFITLIATALVEVVLTLSWTPAYFRHGIPLFRKRCSVSRGLGPIPTHEALEQALESGSTPNLVFRPIGNGEFAFREAAWGGIFKLSYTPLMHGRLSFDRIAGTVTVHGLANLWCLLFLAVWASHSLLHDRPGGGSLVLAFAPLVIITPIYLIQAHKYATAARSAALLWESSISGVETSGGAA